MSRIGGGRWHIRHPEEEDGLEPPVHVYPIGDLKEHVLEGEVCWCQPTVDRDEVPTIVVHNSMDGRERYETGQREKH